MAHFYRYVRPLSFVERRTELQTLPHGGVCLRFDEHDNYCTFTHARCHENELFSKAVAKRIVDIRAERLTVLKIRFKELPQVSLSMNSEELIMNVILESQTWHPEQKCSFVNYFTLELHELADCLLKILRINEQQKSKAEIWKAGIKAAHFKEQYANISKNR